MRAQIPHFLLHNISSPTCPPQTNVLLEPMENCLMKARSSGTMTQMIWSPLLHWCHLPLLCLRQQPSMHFSMEHPPLGPLFLLQAPAVLLRFRSHPNVSSM